MALFEKRKNCITNKLYLQADNAQNVRVSRVDLLNFPNQTYQTSCLHYPKPSTKEILTSHEPCQVIVPFLASAPTLYAPENTRKTKSYFVVLRRDIM